MRTVDVLPRLAILGAALLFSTGGAAIKACGFGGLQVAGLRSAVAAVAVLVWLPAARRALSVRAALVGITYAATLVLFVLANKLTTAANAIFLQSTAPLYVLFLAPWLLGERAKPRDLVVMALIAVGLSLFFVAGEPPRDTAPQPLIGNVLAVCSGLTWALTLLGLRWLEKLGAEPGAGLGSVVIGNVMAAAVCLPLAGGLAYGHFGDWLLVAYLGVFQIGAAYALLTRGFRHVPAIEASLLILVEPALNPVWAWLFQGEAPAPLALLGGVVILAASAARAWLGRPANPGPGVLRPADRVLKER